ncbi:hypothetical protein [Butyrivibrio sp. VCB2006]|uniref:hypothetical protein n=1 Tax=Butyrivibrio sp. VCB2006 TaxID=1280679 RepID=UPI0003F633A1|nr:hypothetical protein [Butyrivibrio sp. VCB2006]
MENTNELTPEYLEQRLLYVESIFEKYGAKPLDINAKNRAKFDQRRAFLYEGNYYRTGLMEFDEGTIPYIVISCIDDEKFADVGAMEDIDAFSAVLSDEEIEKQVRYAFGIEPYPEEYGMENE